jgi:hypothetical protein
MVLRFAARADGVRRGKRKRLFGFEIITRHMENSN